MDNCLMSAVLNYQSPDTPMPAPRSFLEYSASRVGQIWTDEDHAALLRHLAQVDELCIEVWKRLRASDSRRVE